MQSGHGPFHDAVALYSQHLARSLVLFLLEGYILNSIRWEALCDDTCKWTESRHRNSPEVLRERPPSGPRPGRDRRGQGRPRSAFASTTSIQRRSSPARDTPSLAAWIDSHDTHTPEGQKVSEDQKVTRPVSVVGAGKARMDKPFRPSRPRPATAIGATSTSKRNDIQQHTKNRTKDQARHSAPNCGGGDRPQRLAEGSGGKRPMPIRADGLPLGSSTSVGTARGPMVGCTPFSRANQTERIGTEELATAAGVAISGFYHEIRSLGGDPEVMRRASEFITKISKATEESGNKSDQVQPQSQRDQHPDERHKMAATISGNQLGKGVVDAQRAQSTGTATGCKGQRRRQGRWGIDCKRAAISATKRTYRQGQLHRRSARSDKNHIVRTVGRNQQQQRHPPTQHESHTQSRHSSQIHSSAACAFPSPHNVMIGDMAQHADRKGHLGYPLSARGSGERVEDGQATPNQKLEEGTGGRAGHSDNSKDSLDADSDSSRKLTLRSFDMFCSLRPTLLKNNSTKQGRQSITAAEVNGLPRDTRGEGHCTMRRRRPQRTPRGQQRSISNSSATVANTWTSVFGVAYMGAERSRARAKALKVARNGFSRSKRKWHRGAAAPSPRTHFASECDETALHPVVIALYDYKEMVGNSPFEANTHSQATNIKPKRKEGEECGVDVTCSGKSSGDTSDEVVEIGPKDGQMKQRPTSNVDNLTSDKNVLWRKLNVADTKRCDPLRCGGCHLESPELAMVVSPLFRRPFGGGITSMGVNAPRSLQMCHWHRGFGGLMSKISRHCFSSPRWRHCQEGQLMCTPPQQPSHLKRSQKLRRRPFTASGATACGRSTTGLNGQSENLSCVSFDTVCRVRGRPETAGSYFSTGSGRLRFTDGYSIRRRVDEIAGAIAEDMRSRGCTRQLDSEGCRQWHDQQGDEEQHEVEGGEKAVRQHADGVTDTNFTAKGQDSNREHQATDDCVMGDTDDVSTPGATSVVAEPNVDVASPSGPTGDFSTRQPIEAGKTPAAAVINGCQEPAEVIADELGILNSAHLDSIERISPTDSVRSGSSRLHRANVVKVDRIIDHSGESDSAGMVDDARDKHSSELVTSPRPDIDGLDATQSFNARGLLAARPASAPKPPSFYPERRSFSTFGYSSSLCCIRRAASSPGLMYGDHHHGWSFKTITRDSEEGNQALDSTDSGNLLPETHDPTGEKPDHLSILRKAGPWASELDITTSLVGCRDICGADVHGSERYFKTGEAGPGRNPVGVRKQAGDKEGKVEGGRDYKGCSQAGGSAKRLLDASDASGGNATKEQASLTRITQGAQATLPGGDLHLPPTKSGDMTCQPETRLVTSTVAASVEVETPLDFRNATVKLKAMAAEASVAVDGHEKAWGVSKERAEIMFNDLRFAAKEDIQQSGEVATLEIRHRLHRMVMESGLENRNRVEKEAALEEMRRVWRQDTAMYEARASASTRMLKRMKCLEAENDSCDLLVLEETRRSKSLAMLRDRTERGRDNLGAACERRREEAAVMNDALAEARHARGLLLGHAQHTVERMSCLAEYVSITRRWCQAHLKSRKYARVTSRAIKLEFVRKIMEQDSLLEKKMVSPTFSPGLANGRAASWVDVIPASATPRSISHHAIGPNPTTKEVANSKIGGDKPIATTAITTTTMKTHPATNEPTIGVSTTTVAPDLSSSFDIFLDASKRLREKLEILRKSAFVEEDAVQPFAPGGHEC